MQCGCTDAERCVLVRHRACMSASPRKTRNGPLKGFPVVRPCPSLWGLGRSAPAPPRPLGRARAQQPRRLRDELVGFRPIHGDRTPRPRRRWHQRRSRIINAPRRWASLDRTSHKAIRAARRPSRRGVAVRLIEFVILIRGTHRFRWTVIRLVLAAMIQALKELLEQSGGRIFITQV